MRTGRVVVTVTTLREQLRGVVTVDDIRAIVADLPRAYEVVVRDRIKFRVGRIVFASLSRDETLLGFGFPKEERAALVASDPDRFLMPVRVRRALPVGARPDGPRSTPICCASCRPTPG